jgi:hypothetical protein
MTKFSAFVILVVLRIIYQPGNAPDQPMAFANTFSLSPSTNSVAPAKFRSINGSLINNKIILNWIIDENETAYCLIIFCVAVWP